MGLENRSAILPTPNIPDKTPGVFGPDYSFADNVPLPGDVGIRDGDSISSVIDAVKGAAYYVDLIGFGESSSPLTRGVGPGGGPKRLGVNTWMKTGFQCSNGADMYMYIEGIPTGNALGKRLSDGLASAGMPRLRGLAPGILEDVGQALDPRPIMSAVFGTGFPICRLEDKQVGDQDGNYKNTASDTPDSEKAFYVEDPDSVTCTDGGVPDKSSGRCSRGVPVQRRWIKDGDLAYEAYKNAAKTHCPEGYTKTSHRDQDCKKELISRKYEGFTSGNSPRFIPSFGYRRSEGFASGAQRQGWGMSGSESFLGSQKKDKAIELFAMIGAAAGILLFVGIAFKLARDH